jgi:dTDP-4-dehydrorhamnose reductase
VSQAGCACFILRTAWVYSMRPESFVGKVLSWSRQKPVLKVVSDQVGSPTWARLLAEVTALMLATGKEDLFEWGKEKAGLYHLAGEGTVNRYDWAKQIMALDPRRDEQICREIVPTVTAEFPTPAARPLNSSLNCNKFKETFGLSLGSWHQGLNLAMH